MPFFTIIPVSNWYYSVLPIRPIPTPICTTIEVRSNPCFTWLLAIYSRLHSASAFAGELVFPLDFGEDWLWDASVFNCFKPNHASLAFLITLTAINLSLICCVRASRFRRFGGLSWSWNGGWGPKNVILIVCRSILDHNGGNSIASLN